MTNYFIMIDENNNSMTIILNERWFPLAGKIILKTIDHSTQVTLLT